MANLITPVQGILLDVDGTCLDSMHPQYDWLRQTAEKYGGISPFPAFSPDFLREYNKRYSEQSMKGLYDMAGVDFDAHREEIWRDYNEFNRTHHIEFVPGVDNAIKTIHQRSRVTRTRPCALRIGFNTTKSWADIEIPLRRSGVLNCIDTIVAKDHLYALMTDGEARRKNIPFDDYRTLRTILPEHIVRQLEKPGSIATTLALNRLGVDMESTIAFEDTVDGIQSYKSVLLPRGRKDIFVVGVTWGYEQDKTELIKADPDAIIDRPEQMVELIGDLGGFK
jgi:beta-phosphoglucomutase-like phosphatase (HAD superfamily)